jgi:glycosyltransferase involved in cell wall biosynthesis
MGISSRGAVAATSGSEGFGEDVGTAGMALPRMAAPMKVLHVYNRHRGGGGSDNACEATIALSREHGLEVETFSRDSRELPAGMRGKLKAFTDGIYAREAVRDFGRVLGAYRPDVVHAHELFPLISPWVLPVAARAGIPVVLTCYDFRLTCPVATHFTKGAVCLKCAGGGEHWAVLKNCRGNYAESLAYALRNAVARRFRLVTKHVGQFVVLTEFSKRWLMDDVGIGAERIAVIPCVIPVPDPPGDAAAGAYVAYAGRFVTEKGVDLLIEAARRTGIPVKLAGNAPTHPAIRPGDPVECVRTESREALLDFYRGARVLVVPSVWYETFGIVAAEAMSLGIPVLASRIGALQDTVEEGVSGLLFEPGNVADLASKLTHLWKDPQLCGALGAAGRRRVQERFSVHGHLSGLLAAYDSARRNTRPDAAVVK